MVSQAFQSALPQVPVNDIIAWPRFQPAGAPAPRAAGRQGSSGLALRRPHLNQVHLWAACLEAPASARAAYQKMLSSSELERASRFRFEQLRNR